MAAQDDEKTASSTSLSRPPSNIDICSQIYNEIDSYMNGSINLNDEKQVLNAFKSIHKQIEELQSNLQLNKKKRNSKKGLPPPAPPRPGLSNKASNNNSNKSNTNNDNNIDSDDGSDEMLPSEQTTLMREETKNLPRELMKEGFVEKRGEGPLKGWKKRYLQLFSNKTIDYYVDSTLKDLKGTIYLSKSNIKTNTKFENSIEINYNVNFGFNIHCINRKWEFKVNSTTERAQWITSLNECIEARGLTYHKAKSLRGGNNNDYNDIYKASSSLNNPQSKIDRPISNSISLLGNNNEYLESVQQQINDIKTTKHESTDDYTYNVTELNVPERKFLQLQDSTTSDIDSNTKGGHTDSIDI